MHSTSPVSKARRIALAGLFLALTLTLSYLEHLIPALPFLPPGVKLGPSNIIVMYCLFAAGAPSAFLLAILKSIFVLLTRGMVSGLLSACGGLSALLGMVLLLRLFRLRISYTALSVAGAILHNLGQLAGASLLVSRSFLYYYIPVLLISGLAMGLITGTLLRVVMPALRQLERSGL